MMIQLPNLQNLIELKEEVFRYNNNLGHYKAHPQVYSHVKNLMFQCVMMSQPIVTTFNLHHL
jgi:hypothetical protein